MGKLLGVFCKDFEENWRFNGTTQYVQNFVVIRQMLDEVS